MLLCPKCWNTICDCKERKVEIDDKIAPAIAILNNKGYETSYCCAGHAFRFSLQPPAIYVKFKSNVILDSYVLHHFCPNWKYISSHNLIEYKCKEKFLSSVLELNRERENLLKLALELPTVGTETTNEQEFNLCYERIESKTPPYKGVDR